MSINLNQVDERLRRRVLDQMLAEDEAKKSQTTEIKQAVRGRIPLVAGKRVRQSRDSLNKLEARFLAVLASVYPLAKIRAQSKRYRVGSVWYKPDFVLQGDALARETAFEVKGPRSWRGGFENLKNAAVIWPEVDWVLVWEENGVWKEQWMDKTTA